jgi:hypothetical protein
MIISIHPSLVNIGDLSIMDGVNEIDRLIVSYVSDTYLLG